MKLLPYSFGKRLLATALVGLLLLCATDHQVEGLSPRSRVAVGSNSTLKYWSGHHHRGRWQGSTKLNVARTDRTIMTITKLLRGGGFSLTTSVGNLIKNVGESKTKCWIALIISILGETFSTSLNKYAKQTGSVRLFFMASSLYLLTTFGFNMSLAKIEVGVAYAMWSALGCLIVSGVGIVFFGESYDLAKIVCLLLITAGVVGLNLRSTS